MPWYFPWSESIKKRACRYLLQHYLGDFLKEKLDLDQLTVDIYNGKGTVTDVPLDVWALNEMLSNAGIPLEIIDGFITSIAVAVPWKALLSDSCEIEIQGLKLTFGPKQKLAEGSLVDSTYTWSSMSMTTSMQMAQECLRHEESIADNADDSGSFEGLEAFAKTIESVLARVRLSFIDSVVRFEHIPNGATSGVGIELHIDRVDFKDLSHEEVGSESMPTNTVYEPVAIAIKNFQMVGVSLHLEEFLKENRTRLREACSTEEINSESPFSLINEGLSRYMQKPVDEQKEPPNLLPKVKIMSSCGKQNIKIRLKQNDALPGPKVEVDYALAAVNVFLSPRQLHLLIDAASAIPEPGKPNGNDRGELSNNGMGNQQESKHSKTSKMREMRSEDYLKVEESLQHQFESEDWKKTLHSMGGGGSGGGGANNTTYTTIDQHSACSDEEDNFFSMTDFSLPALGQPYQSGQPTSYQGGQQSLLGAVKQSCGGVGGTNIDQPSRMSPSSPKSLSNVSLGGSSGSLGSRGTLTERASTIIRGSSFASPGSGGGGGARLNHGLYSPPTNNIGLAGVGNLDDSDVTFVKLRANNVIVFLLIRDPVETTTDGQHGENFITEMSEMFFSQIGEYSIQTLFGVNGDHLQENLLSVCMHDHIRILGSALTLECDQKTISGSQSMTTDIIIGKIAVDENLYDDSINRTANSTMPYAQTKLLHFKMSEESPLYPGTFGASQSPCIKVKISKTSRISAIGVNSRSTVPPKSSISVDLGILNTELDLTIMDRIVALVWPEPLFQATTTNFNRNNMSNMYASLATGRSANRQGAFRQVLDDTPLQCEGKTEVVVRCPTATLLLRFPVPDLRPSTDIEKGQWWRKTIHKESLKLELNSLEVKTTLHSLHNSSYEISFKRAKGYFITPSSCYHLFNIESNSEEGETGSMGIDVPRILISSSPQSSRSILEESGVTQKDSSPDSIDDIIYIKTEPSPFSTKPNMYENEEMVIPGTIEEMKKFQEYTTMYAKLTINCYLPCFEANLHTSDIFEVLYNRLCGDLALWEPSAPSPIDLHTKLSNPYESVHINLESHIGQFNAPGGGGGVGGGGGGGGNNDKFFMCRSAIRDAYETHSNETSFMSGDYYEGGPQFRPQEQTKMCMSLHIDKGVLALFPPCKEVPEPCASTSTSYTSADQPENIGHVVLSIKDGHLFYANGYRGNPCCDFMELYTTCVDVHHSPRIHDTTDLMCLEEALSCHTLVHTLYPSEPGVASKCKAAQGVGTENVAMFSLAMKSLGDFNTGRKDNKVSIGCRGGTLNHKLLPPGQSWLEQLMDFMDVKDYPILGYTFPTVITTLHAHLWGCAVDYRPLHLPVHCLLTIETFSVSSNCTPGSDTSLLRFLIEDSNFYICDKSYNSDYDFSDYVSVMDMGMFELSLKMTDVKEENSATEPSMELNMSNSMLHIRTCADSCVALMKLIKYFASDGDMNPEVPTELDGDSVDMEVKLPSLSISDENVGGAGTDHLDSLMADAMIDDSVEKITDPVAGCEVGDVSDVDLDPQYLEGSSGEDLNSSSGDEFCFLENEVPSQETDHEPIVNKLTNKEIVIIDDYLQISLTKRDELGSPDGFPTPVAKYTIREMSLVWQMYGGCDFVGSQSRKTSSLSGSPTNICQQQRRRPSNQKSSLSPGTKHRSKCKGGPYRDLDTLMELQLNKIRFQHEIYPDSGKNIYRDIILIHEVEIRDRLSSSRINKFLYPFTSENFPKQSSANMVSVKVLVTKPEDDARNEEASLRISLQPLRLNVDQDSLFFLKDFFATISGAKPPKASTPDSDLSNMIASSPGREPFQTVADSPSPSPAVVRDENLSRTVSRESLTNKSDKDAMFFKSFVFSPEVPIRLDYHGKHVDIEQGTLAGLIIGLSQLNCSELRLKRLCSRSGLLGLDKLINYILTEWLNDIRQNQLQTILGGVGPTYSLLQLFQGIKDLFWMPVQQYRHDGRIVRGLQRGANSFSASTAMAVLELSNRLVSTVQSLAELTFDMVSPGPSHKSSLQPKNVASGVHPAELREGVANAYTVLTEGLSQTASNIVRVATEEHEKKGMTGAVGGVIRQIPPTIVKPLILATEATSNVLGGAMNQLAPDKRKEALEKWKQDTTQ